MPPQAGKYYRHPQTGAILFVTLVDPGKVRAFPDPVDVEFRVDVPSSSKAAPAGYLGVTTLEDAATWIERPSPPTSVRMYTRSGESTFDVTPTDAVAWSADYDGWICHYRTQDERIPQEFRSWRALWRADLSAWEPAEI